MILALAIGIPLVLLLYDFCRVQVALHVCVSRATLGETVQQTMRRLGEPDSRGEWSGSYGTGVFLSYRRPYAWEHIFAVGRALLNIRDPLPGVYVWDTDSWYRHNSSMVSIYFSDAEELVEVTKRGFARNARRVVKSSHTR